jgi:hypothetical protein
MEAVDIPPELMRRLHGGQAMDTMLPRRNGRSQGLALQGGGLGRDDRTGAGRNCESSESNGS